MAESNTQDKGMQRLVFANILANAARILLVAVPVIQLWRKKKQT